MAKDPSRKFIGRDIPFHYTDEKEKERSCEEGADVPEVLHECVNALQPAPYRLENKRRVTRGTGVKLRVRQIADRVRERRGVPADKK
jgi:hypothetical protein